MVIVHVQIGEQMGHLLVLAAPDLHADRMGRSGDPGAGGKIPGLDALKKIALGLEVSLDWLVFDAQPVGDDLARIVRLSAMSGALPCFELLLNKLQQGEAVLRSDGTLLGLTPQEWAADIGWRAGDKAKEISETGTNRFPLIDTRHRFH